MSDQPEHPQWLTDWISAAPPLTRRSATFDPDRGRWQRWEQGACYEPEPFFSPLEPMLSEEGAADDTPT